MSKEEQHKIVERCGNSYWEIKDTPVVYRKRIIRRLIDYFTENKESIA
jgi:hypothetical protein